MTIAATLVAPAACSPSATRATGFSLPAVVEAKPDVAVSFPADKPIVVNFFAAWCEPCRRELPLLAATATAHPRVRFVGVDHQDSRSNATDLLDETHVPYESAYDPQGTLASRFVVRGFPTTLFVAADGTILERVRGELKAAQLDALLLRLEGTR